MRKDGLGGHRKEATTLIKCDYWKRNRVRIAGVFSPKETKSKWFSGEKESVQVRCFTGGNAA